MDWKEVKSMAMQDVVNDNEWQALRKSFLGTWKLTPESNIKRLREYLGDMTDPSKIRRVKNYLYSSGFRIGIISHKSIIKLRKEVGHIWNINT